MKFANLFNQRGFPKTSKELSNFADRLRDGKIPCEKNKIVDAIYSVVTVLEYEFVNSQFIGRTFRKKCYQEMIFTVYKALKNMGVIDFIRVSKEPFQYFSKRVAEVLRNIRPFHDYQEEFVQEIMNKSGFVTKNNISIAEETSGTIEKTVLLFHFKAYLYLLFIEGVFDDITRLWYFHKYLSINPNYTPISRDLKRLNVDGILHTLRRNSYPIPIFLENWKEKKFWRNAIAHCTVNFDPKKKIIHFVVYDRLNPEITVYDEFVILHDFQTVCLELEDTLNAFDLGLKVLQMSAELGKNLQTM